MERRANLGLGALKIIGFVYFGLGGLFFLLGVSLWVFLIPEDHLIGFIFTIIGGVFLILGFVFLCVEAKKQQKADRLLSAGRYVTGEVADLRLNANVTVNGHHPTVVLVRCLDSQGRVHIYRSRNVNAYVDRSIIGKPVRVYTEAVGSKDYYVDLEGVLPQVIEH